MCELDRINPSSNQELAGTYFEPQPSLVQVSVNFDNWRCQRLQLAKAPVYTEELVSCKNQRLKETASLSLTAGHFWASGRNFFQFSEIYHRSFPSIKETNCFALEKIPQCQSIESSTTYCYKIIYVNLPDAGIWEVMVKTANSQNQERNEHHSS